MKLMVKYDILVKLYPRQCAFKGRVQKIKSKKKWTRGALWGGRGLAEIGGGPHYYCDFWGIKLS